MKTSDYLARAELYLGRDWETAAAQGPRTFRTAAQAIRFALEEAAPVSLHGARLHIGDKVFSGDELKWLYRGRDYPLPRKPQLNRDPTARRRPQTERNTRWTPSITAHRPSSTPAAAMQSR